jgi:phosphoenolpyruvate carboxylase
MYIAASFVIWLISFTAARSKPTPVDEAKGGFAIVENVLWEAVPTFLRKLNDVVEKSTGSPLPLTIAPIKLASWMGGDRDGNPNVTPAITLEVCMLSRWMAATLLINDLKNLRSELSLKSGSAELVEFTKGAYEPYRFVLKGLENRLSSTLEWTMQQIKPDGKVLSSVPPLVHNVDIMEPLLLLHRSLLETKNAHVANGKLVDVIRKVAVFGLQLMPLDIRQESTRHTEALDAITNYLGMGSYKKWDEKTRREWIEEQLASKRPLLSRGKKLSVYGFPPTVHDTLSTFELIAALEPGSLGAYVISQCQQASDVMAVALLQQDAGVLSPLRVVPLFETLEDLERSATTVDALFSSPVYKSLVGNKHEIMVGYSDSAKDAGRLAASWAQYNAQVAMIEAADKHGMEITFFHGKGGTVGRGGNPEVFKAILAHPPHTINGRFRVTEQGEMITQNFGSVAIAERTLDIFTAGVLCEKFEHRPVPKKEWLDMMKTLSELSCEAYRNVVVKEPRFVPYFRSATPEMELAGLNVGSRPAKRNPKGGVESLRAIPWIFAWTQTRLNLPAWLGVGDALNAKFKTDDKTLKEMYAKWPWFQTIIDLLEMILVKSELHIAENYDKQLVADEASRTLGAELRSKLMLTAESVLAVSGHMELQENNTVLLRSLLVRNPYVDPLNIIQAELLRRLRLAEGTVSDADKEILRDALLVTINGVANGMRNSG